MNAVTPTSQPTKLDQFRMEILPPDRRQELIAGMPPHVRPERFERNLVNALMQNPGLMLLDPRLIFREVSKAAALGLYLDPQLGEAYLIESWNGKAKRKEPQLRVGYRGLIKLGRQSGEITMLYAHEVNEHDVLDVDQGAEKKLVHKPKLFTDRGPVIGYYAVVKYKEGDFDFEPLSIPQAHKIRDRSDGWKAFQEGKIKSTPWATDEEEMCKKTVIRRLAKRIPQSPELAEAIRIEDAADHSDIRSAIAATPSVRLAPPDPDAPVQIEHQPSSASTAPQPPADDVRTGGGAEVASPPAPDPDEGEPIDMGAALASLESDLALATDEATIEEIYVGTDIEARLAETESGVDLARKVKARHVERVQAAASRAGRSLDDGDAGAGETPDPKQQYFDQFLAEVKALVEGGGKYADLQKLWRENKNKDKRAELGLRPAEVARLNDAAVALLPEGEAR